ncbi:hypothetical protein L4C39_03245 [Vibrio clamense]|uniref:hypothetical protein n=1 Tax=Vibrio clamense TaxID=2910254 RepID=UPI003D256ED1
MRKLSLKINQAAHHEQPLSKTGTQTASIRLPSIATMPLCMLLLTGCGEVKELHACFTPIQTSVEEMFLDGTVRVTPTWSSNHEEKQLRDSGVKGYLSIYADYKPISRSSALYLNGSVFKFTPGVVERYLGGSMPRVLYRARIKADHYVIPEHEFKTGAIPPLVNCN